jgi:threonine dehydratase
MEKVASRVSGYARRTPLVYFGRAGDREIYLKLENLQPTGSYKIRSAANAIGSLDADALRNGVCTASAGNMAEALAYISYFSNFEARVYLPDTTPRSRVDRLQTLGAKTFIMSVEEWWKALETRSAPGDDGFFLHPCADQNVIDGNGTMAAEILEDLPSADAIITPFGGGGLTAGVASIAKAIRPEIKAIVCESELGAPLSAARVNGRPTPVPFAGDPFLMGLGASSVLSEIWPVVRPLVDKTVLVSRAEVAEAVCRLMIEAKIVAQGAGAAATAAALKSDACGPGKIVCVVSGGNIDRATLRDALSGEIR